MDRREEFEIANRAFELFSLPERHRALEEFGRLRYPSVIDRFTEAVHRVIVLNDAPASPVEGASIPKEE